MELFKTVILGIIQGLTEFLPVSSSGHLVLAQHFFGIKQEQSLIVEVLLHLATGIAVLYVFRNDIIDLIRGIFSTDQLKRKDSLTYSGWIILGTIPAAFAGVFLKDMFEGFFNSPLLASGMLMVTALLLFFSGNRKDSPGTLTAWKVIAIGLIQATAITPGISRSGSTIAMALLIGVSREEAGRFSFLLSLPAIFGAALLEMKGISAVSLSAASLIGGFTASLVVGILALKLLLTFVKKGKLHYFGYYCIAVALGSFAYITFFQHAP
ncbi:MAG: undecaprenyl-diphosphate phosphatase [Chitinispirillaceae bacterium]